MAEKWEEEDNHYESGLGRLWGPDVLDTLRYLVRTGEIAASEVRSLAQHRRVQARNVYNENRHLPLNERFERILEFWFNQELCRLQPLSAADLLMEVLIEARCTLKVISIIEQNIEIGFVGEMVGEAEVGSSLPLPIPTVSKHSGYSEIGGEGNMGPQLTTSKTDGFTTDMDHAQITKVGTKEVPTYNYLQPNKKLTSIMAITGAKIKMSSSKDKSLSFLITGKGDTVIKAKRAIQQGFEPCIFEKKCKSQTFLKGALKISRSTFQDQFRFFGRLAGNQEFNEVSHFLCRKSMVNVAY